MSKLFDAIERIRHIEADKAVALPPDDASEAIVLPQDDAGKVVASPLDDAEEAFVLPQDDADKAVASPLDDAKEAFTTSQPMQPAELLWRARKILKPEMIIRLTVAMSLLVTISWYIFSGSISTKNSDHSRRTTKGGPPVVAINKPSSPASEVPTTNNGTVAIPLTSGTTEKNSIANVMPRTMAELNNRGIELVASNDLWRGLYYFDQARLADPRAVEPLINMGVTLSELGLFAPAVRIFKQVRALAPNHPDLLYNIESLASRGLGRPL
ncbi:MAG TPA: hypothetical protein DEQ20_07615 [Desulfobulbaceae bacterium]|nr:MAG: hypothetical protein A2520_03915 [Deltaproteobacteria bacterium RIFOXYD12_FULL_53_23]HCC54774.1 hypothetical protein [Desulfobulbaceae bacterium]